MPDMSFLRKEVPLSFQAAKEVPVYHTSPHCPCLSPDQYSITNCSVCYASLHTLLPGLEKPRFF